MHEMPFAVFSLWGFLSPDMVLSQLEMAARPIKQVRKQIHLEINSGYGNDPVLT
jgi:hypothetical protein